MLDKLTLLEGDAVEAQLKSPELLEAWWELARQDPKLTVIQEPPFVTTWYSIYRSHYRPLLCLAHDQRGRLSGLLPLARHRKRGTITHAGGEQAEYHGWICRPELEQDFPARCLAEVNRRYAPRRWVWRWLPPGASSSWLEPRRLRALGLYMHSLTQDSPIVDLTNGERLQALRSRKAFKSKRSRLKRLGEYGLEIIQDKHRALELMPYLRRQYDFRQRAMNDVSPFSEDMHKARFYVERMSHPEANHFTALWAGGRPLAFHFGARDKQHVILGLITYDPREAKNSPAHVLLLELLWQLREEGVETFDLTPGGDDYKDRYSNASQPLVAPTFFSSRSDYLLFQSKRQARQLAKRTFSQLGIPPQQVLETQDKVQRTALSLKAASLSELLQLARTLVYNKQEYALYRLKDKSNFSRVPAAARHQEVRVQQYQDLLSYQGHHRWLSQRDLLLQALRKLASGEVLYLINRDGGVAHFAWMKQGSERLSFKKIERTINLPPGSVLIYDFYNNAECCYDGCPCSRNLHQMVVDSLRAGAAEVFVGIDSHKPAFKQMMESSGFALSGSLYDERLLWWRRQGMHLAAPH